MPPSPFLLKDVDYDLKSPKTSSTPPPPLKKKRRKHVMLKDNNKTHGKDYICRFSHMVHVDEFFY